MLGMKRPLPFVAPLALAVFLSVPFVAAAAIVSCTSTSCPSGYACNQYTGTCVLPSQANCVPGYISKDCPNGIAVPTSQSPGGINPSYLQQYSGLIVNAINLYIVPVLFAVAFFVFLWGVYKYFILGATNEGEKRDGRKFVFWSVIGFVVILSVWGLVGLLGSTFGLSPGGGAPPYPTL